MNPFDLRGPDFLILFGVLSALTVVLAAVLRWSLRGPDGDGPIEVSDLSPYHIAYLAGGARLPIHAAVAALVKEDAIHVSKSKHTLSRKDQVPEQAHPLERAVHAHVACSGEMTLSELGRIDSKSLTRLHQELEEQGLLVAPAEAGLARVLPTLLVLAVTLLGMIKVAVGVARDRPVLFLVLGCVATAVVAFAGFARPVLRSRRGDRLLARLRAEHAPLASTAHARAEALAASDVTLAVGLFGIGILATGPYADLRAARKASDTAGWSSHCGSGCGGGGGGGGCGGGGCGGGGCGGCGG